jgi:hypothetical protein
MKHGGHGASYRVFKREKFRDVVKRYSGKTLKREVRFFRWYGFKEMAVFFILQA